MNRVLISEEASRDLARLPANAQEVLLDTITALGHGIPSGAVKVSNLSERLLFAARAGKNWRVIFSPDARRKEVTILKILGHTQSAETSTS
jgi:mRNA-degrading endonuclease RelE of RelBE toxin-antitoxin system